MSESRQGLPRVLVILAKRKFNRDLGSGGTPTYWLVHSEVVELHTCTTCRGLIRQIRSAQRQSRPFGAVVVEATDNESSIRQEVLEEAMEHIPEGTTLLKIEKGPVCMQVCSFDAAEGDFAVRGNSTSGDRLAATIMALCSSAQ
ncbi:MAG: hypothetical protein ABIB97_03020 [Patescibacteria group bacterium]